MYLTRVLDSYYFGKRYSPSRLRRELRTIKLYSSPSADSGVRTRGGRDALSRRGKVGSGDMAIFLIIEIEELNIEKNFEISVLSDSRSTELESFARDFRYF